MKAYRKLLIVSTLIIVVFISSCSKREVTVTTTAYEDGGQDMRITSPAFKNNKAIPKKYTCDGENISPALGIRDIPENTKILVLIMDDPDAPGGTFTHWVVWNIPFFAYPPSPLASGRPPLRMLHAEIYENSVLQGMEQGFNSAGKIEYIGPCPSSGKHRYFFKLYALDTVLPTRTDMPPPNKKSVEEMMKGHILAQAELIGLYGR